MKTMFVIRTNDGYEVEAHETRAEAVKAVDELMDSVLINPFTTDESSFEFRLSIHEEVVTYPDDPRMPS
jgi:hypothetical protein